MTPVFTRPGSHAIVHGDEPMRFYAENQEVMDRALGVHLVAQLPADRVSSDVKLQRLRRALTEGRWGDALVDWIDETDRAVDVYDYPPDVYDPWIKVWTDDELSPEGVQATLKDSPLFTGAKQIIE